MALITRIVEVNTGSAATTTAAVTTKRFDFGSPDVQKRFSKIVMVYKASSAVTVGVYLDTAFISGGSADATITFDAQSTIGSVSKAFSSVGKTATIGINSSASNLEIDSIDIDYQPLGSNP
jgi:hypothetical protein